MASNTSIGLDLRDNVIGIAGGGVARAEITGTGAAGGMIGNCSGGIAGASGTSMGETEEGGETTSITTSDAVFVPSSLLSSGKVPTGILPISEAWAAGDRRARWRPMAKPTFVQFFVQRYDARLRETCNDSTVIERLTFRCYE